MRTLYDILGVPRSASEETIKAAFHRAVKVCHPDLNAGNAAAEQKLTEVVAAYQIRHGGDQDAVSRFQDIVAAVAVLRDPGRRAAYDLELRLERRRRREWAAAAILCVVAGAIIGGGLVSGRLVLFSTPSRIVLAGETSVAAAANMAQPGEAQARMEPGDTSVTASGRAAVDRKSAQPEPAVESAVALVASAGSTQRHLDASEIASLTNRGMEFVANGNIGAARMMFKLAAEAGEPTAAFALAETYDPLVLEKRGAKGVTPDVALARRWYEIAEALRSTAAAN
jgi:curved DNA-binding protein CbpA